MTSPIPRVPHYDEVFVMRGNVVEIRRLAMTRSVLVFQDNYWSQPRAAMSNDGAYLVYDSNYGVPNATIVNLVSTGFVPPGVAVGLIPAQASLSASQTQQFTATVSGTGATGVTWSLSPNLGSITSGGLYTAPSSIAALTTVIVTATSVADPSKGASASITLNPPPSGFTAIRVNAGGPVYTDAQTGQVWSADVGFLGGEDTNSTTQPIAGTSTPALYQTERWNPFQYRFTMPNGTYRVNLKFAEIVQTQPGQRIFNVSANGQTLLSNFDILAQAGGPNIAIDKQFTIPVNNGQLILQFHPLAGFAKISAIEIVALPTAVSVTPNAGSGSSQTFGFVFSHPNGFASILNANLLVNSALDGKNACFVSYNRASNAFYLINDTASGSTRVDIGTANSAQNSQCVLNGMGSSATGSGNNLTLNLALTFKPAFAGTKNVYVSAQDVNGSATVLQSLGTWTLPNPSASVVSVTPSSGAGLSQTFSVVMSDVYGYTTLSSASFLINAAPDGKNACFIAFNRLANAVYLINDAGTASTPISLGTPVTAQNSQCSVDGSGTVASGSGNNLTLNLAITFKVRFSGVKNLYVAVQDSAGISTPLQSFGTFNIPNLSPVVVSVTPNSGNGTNQTFNFALYDPSGYSAITTATVLINSSYDGADACFFFYDRASNAIFLVDDSGTSSTRLDLGTSGTVQNNQCLISGAGSTVTASGNNLTLKLALTFRAFFAGARNVYLSAQNAVGLSAGPQQVGTWVVPSGGNLPPSALSVTPSSGSGFSQLFTFQFSDPEGFTDIASTNILINSRLEGTNACFLYFNRASSRVYLINDTSTGSIQVDVGGIGSGQNSQCRIDGGTSSVTSSGNTLTLTLSLTFTPSFAGPKIIYLSVTDNGGLFRSLRPFGTWTVPGNNPPPSVVSVTPSSGAGSSQTFGFLFSHPNGFAALASTTVLINSGLNGANACFVYFDRAANAAYLINDASTGSTRVDLGSASTAQNSQCVLSGSGSSVNASGLNLTLNLALAFKQPAFSGSKSVFMSAQDLSGQSTSLQLRGSWTVP